MKETMFSFQVFTPTSTVKQTISYCNGCLSSDRTLTKLNKYFDIFSTISDHCTKVLSENVLLCWECMAILSKIKLFKDRVHKTQKVLDSYSQNIEKLKSVSRLRIQEANNIICFNHEEERRIDIKEENATSSQISDDEVPLSDIKYIPHEVKEELIANEDSEFNGQYDEVLFNHDGHWKVKKKMQIHNEDPKHKRDTKLPYEYRKIIKIVICDYCGKEYKSKRVLEKHIRNHSATHLCTTCDKIFKTKATLRKHMNIKHVIVNTEHAYCVQCDIQFNNANVYRRHVNTSIKHAAERNGKMSTTKVPCPECGNIYTRKAYMMNHYNHVHRNESKYYCIQCDRKFLNRTKYLDHTKYYHEGKKKDKNNMCYICGRGFAVKRTLINHIRTHSGERPYQCSQCGNRFVQKHAMLTHVKHLHGNKKSGCHK